MFDRRSQPYLEMTDKAFRDRQILAEAHAKGRFSTLLAFFRLSGPGWLQSAITLGGGSLGGALYLGAIGGTSMLWVNLLAIAIGVIMLSAISYVTLSTGKRPYQLINQHINPVLGIGWLGATMLANMIFIIAQFSLCYDVARSNFGLMTPFQQHASETVVQMIFSLVLATVGLVIVSMSFRPGWKSRIFDILLKSMVGLVVVSFVLAVVHLAQQNQLEWLEIGRGLIPDISRWFSTAPALTELSASLEDNQREFWESRLIANQQRIMIGAAATAVGINMTFLLPYSMLARGWDKTFRGFARWDLMTGMAIPFVIVTLCITVASAHAFHGKVDDQFASQDPQEFGNSPLISTNTDTRSLLEDRLLAFNPDLYRELVVQEGDDDSVREDKLQRQSERLIEAAAALPLAEKKLAVALARPNTQQLSQTLTPILGDKAGIVFGLGAFGMGFSTIIVLMLINGFAFAELLHRPDSQRIRLIGSAMAAVTGFCWFLIWSSPSRTWLIILTSNFAAILLPIAYLTFFLLLNDKTVMGDDRPHGFGRTVWNILMVIGIIGATVSAFASVSRIEGDEIRYFVYGGIAIFLMLAAIGFSARSFDYQPKRKKQRNDE